MSVARASKSLNVSETTVLAKTFIGFPGADPAAGGPFYATYNRCAHGYAIPRNDARRLPAHRVAPARASRACRVARLHGAVHTRVAFRACRARRRRVAARRSRRA